MSLTKYQCLAPYIFRDLPRQDFKGQGHYSKVNERSNQEHTITLHVYTPNECLYQVSTSYTLWFLKHCPDKSLKVKVTTARLQVKSRSHHDSAHLQPPTNAPNSINFLHLTVSEILPGQDFEGHSHNSNVKYQIKVTP